MVYNLYNNIIIKFHYNFLFDEKKKKAFYCLEMMTSMKYIYLVHVSYT